MSLDPWLPLGTEVVERLIVGRLVAGGDGWQIYENANGGRALVASSEIAARWISTGCLTSSDLVRSDFGAKGLLVFDGGPGHLLVPLDRCRAPHDKSEAMAFAAAMRETRRAGETGSLEGGIYAERISRVLPTDIGAHDSDDALILGTWLSGGLRISAVPGDRLQSLLTWLSPAGLYQVIGAAGLNPGNLLVAEGAEKPESKRREGSAEPASVGRFTLPGRKSLEAFFNDHVVDVVQNRERYRKLGLGNPPAIVLEGPPGSGKTVAVERLLDFLGWPSFSVDAESVASPFIHETSRKVSSLFREAIDAAPSAIVIDEMDAFLSERDSSVSPHRVEEIAEFLRRIPEAINAGVLIIGMTNRLDAIDAAVLRRGRFDHVVRVDYADAEEVTALLRSMTEGLPVAEALDIGLYGKRLAGRPLSDASFLVREGARVAARNRQDVIDGPCLDIALGSLERNGGEPRKEPIGFMTRRSE